jgi:hypothetical protein
MEGASGRSGAAGARPPLPVALAWACAFQMDASRRHERAGRGCGWAAAYRTWTEQGCVGRGEVTASSQPPRARAAL